jgi:peptidoglycan hydrolase CwlO-like protein
MAEIPNGYVKIPRWLVNVLVGVFIAALSTVFTVIVKNVEADVSALKENQEKMDDRQRAVETSIGIIDAKLENIEKNQSSTDKKIDEILKVIKK